MIKQAKRLSPNERIKRITPQGVTPYTTSAGVQIGIFYQPPSKSYPSDIEEYWQGVLLGIEPEWSRRRIFKWLTYLAFVGFVILTAVKVGW